MKRFKIVKHYHGPDAYLYRVYERYNLFFWSYKAACSTIEQAKHTIASYIEAEERKKSEKKMIPRDEVVYRQ